MKAAKEKKNSNTVNKCPVSTYIQYYKALDQIWFLEVIPVFNIITKEEITRHVLITVLDTQLNLEK